MYKKPVTYKDFNGKELTEDVYFNLTQAELVKMQLGVEGGLGEKIDRIMAAQSTPAIMEVFDELITGAYGVKSDDGKRFMKTDANGRRLAEVFKETAVYDVLFMELCTNADSAAEFINNVIPADLAKELAKNKKTLDAGKKPTAD